MRDASGNVLATYERKLPKSGATYTDEMKLKEQHLYGSSRVGIRSTDLQLTSKTYNFTSYNGVYLQGTLNNTTTPALSMTRMKHTMNMKAYEQSNHLGNVVVTVSDARQVLNSGASVTGYMAIVKSASDYSSFGVTKAGRTYTSTSYRYSFNGKEKENEIASGDLDFGARIYDARLGRWLSVDAKTAMYVSYSPYYGNGNNPIYIRDKDGQVQTDPAGNIIYEARGKSTYEDHGNYDVTITPVYVFGNDGARIPVDKYTVIDKKTGKEVNNNVINESFNCHGHSTLNDKFRVGSSKAESNSLLLDDAGMSGTGKELKDVVQNDFSKIKEGDVIVLFNSEGVAIHSYVYVGDDVTQNVVSSKNGEAPLSEGEGKTKEQIYDLYAAEKDENGDKKDPKDIATSWGYYTPVSDKKVSTDGYVNVNGNGPQYNQPSNGTVEKNTNQNNGNTGTTQPK